MDKFSVGEIAIILAGKNNRFVGEECEILSEEITYKGVLGYDIDIKGRTSNFPKGFFAPTYRLKKKKPQKKRLTGLKSLI